jgi:hypothetical protein
MMKAIRSFAKILMTVLILVVTGSLFINYYSWIFAKTVTGKIVDVQRVTDPSAIIGGSRLTPEQLHSYSILIEGENGKMYTSSSEDRQWQVAGKGYCVTAVLYRYPPWDLEKSGTFFNARIKELRRCDGQPAFEPGSDAVQAPIEDSNPAQ